MPRFHMPAPREEPAPEKNLDLGDLARRLASDPEYRDEARLTVEPAQREEPVAEPADPREPEERGYRPMEREEPDPLRREAAMLTGELSTLPALSAYPTADWGEQALPILRRLLERIVRQTCEAIGQACEPCGGTACIPEPGHDCGGDQERCDAICPVPVESRCEYCGRPIMAVLRRWGLSEESKR